MPALTVPGGMATLGAREAPTRRGPCRDHRTAPVGLAAAAAAIVSLSGPLPASAATVFAGIYADPNHPNCSRTIDPRGVIRGVDPVPFERGAGCNAPGISAKAWSIQGKISPDDRRIVINFDEKDGSGEVFEGLWRTQGSKEGILLPDGTFWSKVAPYPARSDVAGVYDDSSHPGCMRRIDESGAVFGEDPPGPLTPGSPCRPGDETRPWQLPGAIIGDQMVIDFDPIDKDPQGPILAVYKDGILRTANGVWTKRGPGSVQGPAAPLP